MTATITRPRPVSAATRGRTGRVWISYARLSSARNDGKGASLAIDRQHAENRDYVLGVDPAAVILELQDDGYSAFLDVYRPDFETALEMIANGDADCFVGWHADRITRQVEVTGRVWRICETAGVDIHTTLGGRHTDPTTLYVQGIVSEGESRQKRNRMISKHKQLAEAGSFSGGNRRYGYNEDMTEIREDEAAVIRDLATRALLGEPLGSLARSLNVAGIPTARPVDKRGNRREWRTPTVRKLLQGEHLAGFRTFNGVRFPLSSPVILDMATHEALALKFADPERRTTDEPSATKYLLVGIAKCAECGEGLGSASGGTRYRCVREGCGRVNRLRADIDDMVTEYVVARLEGMDENGALASDEANRETSALIAERDEIPARRKALASRWAAGKIDDATHDAMAEALSDREAELGRAIARLMETAAAPIRVLKGATGPEASRAWALWTNDPTGAGLARQRAILAFLVDVAVSPAGRGARTFDPATVSVTMRDIG